MFDGGSLGFAVRCANGFEATIFGDMLRIIAMASKPIVVTSQLADTTILAQQSSFSCDISDCVSRSIRTTATWPSLHMT